MARKLPGFRRELDARALFSVAYGEVASSIYFALGVIAAYALGFTPLVLLGVGALFLVVSLSYAEGTAALPETGGAATFVRRAFNDFAGFVTGWALFLDYVIVIALSALFLPHYAAGAFQVHALDRNPWDVIVAVLVIVVVAVVRLVRRPSLYGVGIVIPALDLLTQLLLVVLGFVLIVSPHSLTEGTSLGTHPSWHSIAFAIPLAMLAFTGLETVANLAEEARRPSVDIPRSVFGGLATVITLYVAIAVVAVSAFPGPKSELGTTWVHAPLLGVADSIRAELPTFLGDALRFYVGITGALILLAAVVTSISGFSRLAYSLGEHGQLPSSFGRLSRRAHVSPIAIVSVAVVASAFVIGTSFARNDVTSLASLFSFGVLLAFTAAQLAVIKLRVDEPDLPRPYRAPFGIHIGRAEIPLPAIVGSIATFVVWIIALATHPAARYAGPLWLAVGIAVFVTVRVSRGEGLLERVRAPDELPLVHALEVHRILVPMKLGIIGEEMLATAIKLASDHGAAVEALHVIRVPLEQALDEPLAEDQDRADEALSEAKALGLDYGVTVDGATVRARAIGSAIVERAHEVDADLIVLGSAPRWRRQSRFFSPTVDYVLRNAPCEVLIVAFPQSVMDEELAAST
ncbi:MAG TPA: universal stress protein [Gaiellaceae bacterium]|nr:universal stress protein [Gaiellaceae bacterium]